MSGKDILVWLVRTMDKQRSISGDIQLFRVIYSMPMRILYCILAVNDHVSMWDRLGAIPKEIRIIDVLLYGSRY